MCIRSFELTTEISRILFKATGLSAVIGYPAICPQYIPVMPKFAESTVLLDSSEQSIAHTVRDGRFTAAP